MADEQLPTWDEAAATARLPTFDQAMRREEMLNQYSQTLTGVGTGGAEAYSGVNVGSAPDAFFSSGPAGHVLSAFGQGAAQEWGAIASGSLSPETEAVLKKNGWFNDYNTNRFSLHKAVNEGLFRTAATLYHGFNALMGGTHEALITAAKEGGPIVGAPFAAAVGAMEAFPVGHGTGLPVRIPRALVEANDLKIIGYGEPGWKGLPSPTQVAIDALRPAEAVDRPGTRLELAPEEAPPAVVAPSDRAPEIHARAREIAPDTFREYDELTQQRETLQQHLDELRGGSQLRDLDEQIDALRAQNLEVPPGAERRALNNQVIELERQRAVLDDQLAKGDTPQMAMVRRALQETDYRMRDLSPDVSAAYRTAAGETRPVAEPGAPAAEAAPIPAAREAAAPIDDPLALQRRGELTAERAAQIRDELGRAAPEAVSAPGAAAAADHLDPKIWTVIADNLEKAEGSREGGVSVVADQMRYLPDDGVPKTISEREAMAVIARALDAEAARGGDVRSFLAEADAAYRAAGHGTPPDVAAAEAARAAPSMAEPARAVPANIAADRSRQLVAAGYPKDVADMAAALEQAHYEMIATVYGGAKGTAEEIYAAMAPEARAGRGARALEMAQRELQPGELGQGPARYVERDGERFVARADGSDVLGEITREIAHAIGREAGPIRLPEGNAAYGEAHVEARVGQAIRAAGYPDAASFINEITSNFDAVYRGQRGRLALTKELPGTTPQTAIVELRPVGAGAHWSVITAYLERPARVARREALWRRSEPGTAPEGASPSVAEATGLSGSRGQSEGSIEPPTAPGKPELEQARRGSIRLADLVKNTRAVITLFKDADASTFIHELGHGWLEELVRFAAEEGAPARMVDDLATVRKWVGAKEGETFTTRQHEQFARGFERYVMEGVAPSRELAGVFAKFKEWLTRIYQTVDRLRAPINDEIRGVYARMLAVEPEAVIAAEREPARNFTATHEADADATGAGQAHSVADQIRGERDAIAGERGSPELDAERRAERGAAENAGDAARGGIPDGGGDAGQLGAQGPGADTGTGTVGAGGTEAAPQGAGGRGTGGGAAATEQPRTPNAPFPRGDSAHIDKAGNIRLDTLGTAEDVNAVIREAAGQGNEFVVARRGVIPDAEVSTLADALGMDAKSLDKRRLGEAFNAEQVMAARKLLVQSATNVRDLAGRVEGGTEADLMAYAEARARHMMIQEQVAGITAEAGRALRAFRAIEGAADAREIGLVLREETGRTLNQLRKEARLLSQLTAPQQVSKAVADLRKATWKDMLIEGWINWLLSGPPTHIANMVGNAGVAVNSILETGLAAGIGATRAALGGAAERVYMGEVASRAFGLVKGSQEGVIAAGKALLDENAVSQSPHTLEQRKFQAIPSVKVNVAGVEMNLGGAQIRLFGRFLTAEDELFKAIAFRQELNALAYRQAAGEGLRGDALHARVADLIENPPDQMVEAAKSNEAYQTFTNPLGPTGRAAQMAVNSSIFAKVIVPFMRTPINLFKYAAERTPFGVLSGEIHDNLMGRNGAVARDTQIARMALGSAIAVSIAGLASSTDPFPVITGAGPSDPIENAKLRQTGWQPYSMKVGNFYYSYAWMDPLATSMGITADMADAVKAGRADDADLGKITWMVVANLSKNIMGKLSLRGTSSLIQALTDPDRYGSKWLQGITGSIVPSAVALSARINDPVLREARSEWDALRARIPGLRQDLVPKIDVWGQPVPNQGALGPDVLSRIYVSRISEDPVNIELQRLGKMPAAVGRKIVGVELTDRQHEDYARTAGTMTKMQLDRLVASPGFAQWPDFAKREAITKLVDGTREQAQELMKMRYPVIWQTALAAKKAEVHGATPAHIKSMLRTPAETVPAGVGR